MTEQFNKGDLVTWSSQAQGSTKVKTGKVVYVLDANAAKWRDRIPVDVARSPRRL